MRILSIILLLGFLNYQRPLVSVTYYVDQTGGNDANNGTSTVTAWKTISKVNGSTFSPTDQILFKAGETWNEKLIPPSSGSAGSVITFGRYGAGANPIITGFTTLGTFTNAGGNIWTKTATDTFRYQNTVMINGVMKAKGRYPNYGYLTMTSGNGQGTQITTDLTGTPDYTGAELVTRSTHWIMDVLKVSSQSGGLINFYPRIIYGPPTSFGCNGYFFQNKASLLDTLGEWSCDSASKLLSVYATSSPTVKISTIDTTLKIASKDYLTIQNINFQGANLAGVSVYSSSHVTIQNCSFDNMGNDAIVCRSSPYPNISNNTINHTYRTGINLDIFGISGEGCDHAIINYNNIKNVGIIPGTALLQRPNYIGIMVKQGLNDTIMGNVIDSTGYSGILILSKGAYVYRNYVTHNCGVSDDGAAIYSAIAGFNAGDGDGMVFRSNIVGWGLTPVGGATTVVSSAGLYCDDFTNHEKYDSNTVYNGRTNSIIFNQSHDDTATNNTVVSSISIGMSVFGDTAVIYNNYIQHNIFLQTLSNPNFQRTFHGGNLTGMDYNFFLQPVTGSPTKPIINVVVGGNTTTGTPQTLAQWQAATGQDLHSSLIPNSVVSSDGYLFYYNPTFADSTITLSGNWFDVRGNTYNGSITLHPFQSAILFKYYSRSIQLLKY